MDNEIICLVGVRGKGETGREGNTEVGVECGGIGGAYDNEREEDMRIAGALYDMFFPNSLSLHCFSY